VASVQTRHLRPDTCTDYAFGFPCRSAGLVGPGCRRGLSVLARGSFSTCSWLLDYAGPDGSSRYRSHQCCLPIRSTWSAPELRFSKLNSRPVDASVSASPGTSRHPAQDSRSRWFATPFLWGSFIPDCTPVYPEDCTPLRPRRTSATDFEAERKPSRPTAGWYKVSLPTLGRGSAGSREKRGVFEFYIEGLVHLI
jgi:hypothetical protein